MCKPKATSLGVVPTNADMISRMKLVVLSIIVCIFDRRKQPTKTICCQDIAALVVHVWHMHASFDRKSTC